MNTDFYDSHRMRLGGGNDADDKRSNQNKEALVFCVIGFKYMIQEGSIGGGLRRIGSHTNRDDAEKGHAEHKSEQNDVNLST